ncbi:uncharacterized protein LOC125026960 [Penaeus chinensis]|uniref:uncharacterized protein LOC125026960 n=1 Tax=Penaeus chinensis TaxID=139456 RepID=UPI001FB7D781|nr:uncharacterized protein LOC125026960 [Penaeus chinensis]
MQKQLTQGQRSKAGVTPLHWASTTTNREMVGSRNIWQRIVRSEWHFSTISDQTILLIRNEGQTGENPRRRVTSTKQRRVKAAYKRAALLAVDTFARPLSMMKFLLLLALAAVAAGDHSLGGHGHFHGGFRPVGHGHFPSVGHGFRHAAVHHPVRPVAPVRPVVHRPAPVVPVHRSQSGPAVPQAASSGVPVDQRQGDSEYHFSWRHDGRKTYTWDRANQYCANLGSGWQGISIGTHQEDSLVREAIIEDRLPWIWTSGHIKNHGFAWASGEEFVGLNWSHTGGNHRPQPDNREGNEHCLGVLNDFYDDGVKWHDIACHHDKAIICERKVQVHG